MASHSLVTRAASPADAEAIARIYNQGIADRVGTGSCWIFHENTASRILMAKLGFREVGIYRRHGKLDGVWRDCVIVERLLGEAVK
jgi:L-amino acid N-acyltransferase YncA